MKDGHINDCEHGKKTVDTMDDYTRKLKSMSKTNNNDLNKHKQVGLRYQHGTQRRLEDYSDADWAVQRSQSGFVFTLGRASISWGSKRQPVVALSTVGPARTRRRFGAATGPKSHCGPV
jgi:hypothetical protein|tara:strand:+ start:1326 stop:1682 length:357 start_codon:yes stop_codon:yes gene_type:complete